MREWKWSFSEATLVDYDGMPDSVYKVGIRLALLDHDLDMREANEWTVEFDMPDPEDFVQYEDVTPEMLRDWVVGYWAHPDRGWPKGKEKWLAKEKQKLIDRLDARNAIRTRNISAIITEQVD